MKYFHACCRLDAGLHLKLPPLPPKLEAVVLDFQTSFLLRQCKPWKVTSSQQVRNEIINSLAIHANDAVYNDTDISRKET